MGSEMCIRDRDNAADIFIKLLLKMDRSAQKLLEKYLADHQKQTDHLISVLSGTVKVYLDKPDSVTAFDPVLGKNSDQLLAMCEQYMAFAGNNYLPSWYNSTKSNDPPCSARLKYSTWHRPRKTRTCSMRSSLF